MDKESAYIAINEAGGCVMTSREDGKRFVTFRLWAEIKGREDETLLAALEAIPDLGDIKGVHLDGIALTEASLQRLARIPSLERLTVRNCGIGNTPTLGAFTESRPDVDVWAFYDSEHS